MSTITIQLTPDQFRRLSETAAREKRTPDEWASAAVVLALENAERYENARKAGRCHGCGAMTGPHAAWCPGSLNRGKGVA